MRDPRIPDGVELVHLSKVTDKDQHLQERRAVSGEPLQCFIDLLQHLSRLLAEVDRSVFCHFNPARDTPMNHNI